MHSCCKTVCQILPEYYPSQALIYHRYICMHTLSSHLPFVIEIANYIHQNPFIPLVWLNTGLSWLCQRPMTGNCEKWRSSSDIPNMYLQGAVGIKLKTINGAYVIIFVWHKTEFCRLMDILVKINAFLKYYLAPLLMSFSCYQNK